MLEQKRKVFKALSEKARLDIIGCLMDKDKACICEISKAIRKDVSVAFRHIEILKDAGIVETHKVGPYLYCSIKDRRMMKRLLE